MAYASKEQAKEYQREYYLRNKQHIAARSKAYYEEYKHWINPSRSEAKKRYYHAHRGRFKGYVLRRYGMTIDDYRSMLSAQDNKCKVCLGAFSDGTKGEGPHVDHDHQSGKVRGIICHRCNTAIGLLRESATLLRKAAIYLEDAR